MTAQNKTLQLSKQLNNGKKFKKNNLEINKLKIAMLEQAKLEIIKLKI